MTMLAGRTALVTGASRGLGSAIAQRLAADGARVAVHYGRDDAAAARTVAAIEDRGGEAFAVRADLADPAGVASLATTVTSELAGRPLDILVNNAAVFAATGSIEDVTLDEFDHSFAVNVRAPLFLVQQVLPVLAEGGRVVNISSGVTRMATPQLTYSMTKGAMTVLGRVGEPADIADAVAFLVSSDARWVTGASLDVSGGLFLGPAPT